MCGFEIRFLLMVVLRYLPIVGEGVWHFFGKQVLMCGWIAFQIIILILLSMVAQQMHGDRLNFIKSLILVGGVRDGIY